MERKPVKSSTIKAIGYDANTSILEVEFLSGAIYQYLNVPTNVFDDLSRAHSKGSYLNDRIKGNFQFRQIS